MWVLILVLGVAGLYNTEAMQSFSKHSNNKPEYRFVRFRRNRGMLQCGF